MLCSTVVFAGEYLENPDFSKGLASWSVYLHPSMRATTKRHIAQGVLTVEIGKSGASHRVQLMQKVAIKNGQSYKLSFDAKREGPESKTQILCSQQGKPFKSQGLNTSVMFLDQWSHHEFIFKAKNVIEKNSPVIRIQFGNQVGTVAFRNFSLTGSSDIKPVIKIDTMPATKNSTPVTQAYSTIAIRIVPQPKQVTKVKGVFLLGETLYIQSNNSKAADLFKREVIFITGKHEDDFQTTTRSSESFFLGVANTADVDLFGEIKSAPRHQGGYALSILPKGIAIKGYDEEGLRNGIQSLLQVLEQVPSGALPQMLVRDLPDLKFRAMHTRLRPPNHFGKDKTIEDALEVYRWMFRRLGRYKYTHVCLMMKGNFKFKKHPEVWPNAVYSHEDVKRFVALANEHGLEVFPEVKTLGKFFFGQPKATLEAHEQMLDRKIRTHTGSWKNIFHANRSGKRLSAEQKQVKGDGGLSIGFNVQNPDVLPLVKDCIDEMYEAFGQPQWFHVGADEAHFFGTSWPKEVNRGQMYANYINALNRHLKQKGCRTMMWGDMLLSHLQFPYFFENHGGPPLNTFEAMPLLDKDIVIADWHYGYEVGGVKPEHYPSVSWFRQHGFDVVGVPWFNQPGMRNFARDIAATSSMGLMGSSWALHLAYNLHTNKDAFKNKPKTRKKIAGRHELGVLASTSEASWSILKSKENMAQYDSEQWEARWLPVKLSP
ncbi:MAG: family 20 glycosylhydrolase [Phycisphaeraceae bacterium]|nr:family 20 glycosylhydrolase [Phycisphaeraceae bacterium]